MNVAVNVVVIASPDEADDVRYFTMHAHGLIRTRKMSLVGFNEAKVVLPFISPSFLEDPFLVQKLHIAYHQQKRIIPVFLKPCDWSNNRHIFRMAGYPEDGYIYVSEVRKNNIDEAWVEVVHGLYDTLNRM